MTVVTCLPPAIVLPGGVLKCHREEYLQRSVPWPSPAPFPVVYPVVSSHVVGVSHCVDFHIVFVWAMVDDTGQAAILYVFLW